MLLRSQKVMSWQIARLGNILSMRLYFGTQYDPYV
jgi:hypothetical protein